MRKILILLAFLGCLSVYASGPTVGLQSISGTDPKLPNSELAKLLNPLIKGYPFIAIGESVHGSAGFIQMQHRLIKFLVEKHNFRLIEWENPVIRSAGLTRWLNKCRDGNEGEAPINLLYQPIQEDLDLFEWMCDFNYKHADDPIVWRGIDIWDRAWEHQERMEKLAAQLNIPVSHELDIAREHCWFHGDKDWSRLNERWDTLKREKKIPDADYKPCLKALREIEVQARQRLAQKSSSPKNKFELHRLVQSAGSATGFQKYWNFAIKGQAYSWNWRDIAQSQNEYSIWLQEGKLKTILVAHTSHTSLMETDSDWWKLGEGAIRSGVSYLKNFLPGMIFTIGLTGYDVTGTQGDFLKPTSPESLDLTLHQKGMKYAFIDSFGTFATSRKRWWIENENQADTYPDGVYMIPKDNFDVLFFMDQSYVGKKVEPWLPVFYW